MPAVREDRRQARQTTPESLQVHVQIKIEGQQNCRRGPIEPGDGHLGLDDGQWGGGDIGQQRDIRGRGDGKPGEHAAADDGQENVSGVLGDFGDVVKPFELGDIRWEFRACNVHAGKY